MSAVWGAMARTRAVGLLRVAVLLQITVLMAVRPAGAQDEIVARGNQAYQEGDYRAAIEAYEAVQDGGFNGPGLEYNLGNAYFKAGELGRAILHWERTLELAPDDADAQANLELARSLTADVVEPMPTFWLTSALSWWLRAFPRAWLTTIVAIAWAGLGASLVVRLLTDGGAVRSVSAWSMAVAAALLVVFGSTLAAREVGLADPDRAIVMAEVVAVRSAPAQDENLTLFEIHEGTHVRLDQRTGEWAEVVLDDGKVGWVPLSSLEII